MITTFDGIYLDADGRERDCLILQVLDEVVSVVDAESGAVIEPTPSVVFKVSE